MFPPQQGLAIEGTIVSKWLMKFRFGIPSIISIESYLKYFLLGTN